MISVENLSKGFGGNILFEGISFKLNSRERVGLVGRNGHGKTTLFRILTGEDQPDTGAVIVPKRYRIGYVRQHIGFTKKTILEEGMTGLPEAEQDHYWKVEKILTGLGFSQTDMQRPPAEFSGGFQVRLNLAKVLVSEPDLLLLDEPTNYLDITSIRWIIKFLFNWPNELMLITHDRGFMDQVVTHTLGLHRRKIRKIEGNTEKYYTQLAQDEEIYEKTRINDEKRRKEIQLFITRFRAKARLANMVQSRIKTLSKMEKKEHLQTIQNLDFSFRDKAFPPKQMMAASGISFSYDGKQPLISNLDFTLKAGDRVCVIGKNGKGKTTLLKLLAGALAPDRDSLVYNPNCTIGFFEQTNIKSLVDSRTVEEEILYTHPDIDRQKARNICGAMMFSGDDALKKISVLSGGEKSRVMLGKLLATPVNLLLLDEPTNHLDMESCDAMLAAIDIFQGAVIMVTHNEMFLHALAEKLIIFQGGSVSLFEGSYQEFLDSDGWEDEEPVGKKSTSKSVDPILSEHMGSPADPPKLTKKELKQKRSAFMSRRSGVLRPMEKKLKHIETRIEAREAELARLNQALVSASQDQDGQKITELSMALHNCQTGVDRLFDELETLTEDYETQKAEFEAKLQLLESDGWWDRERK
jgi:ATP-binding cassette, subfamily F, member 3